MAEKWRDKRLKQGKFKAQTINESFRRVELPICFQRLGILPIDEANLKTFEPALAPLKNSNTLYKINIAINQIFRMAEDEDLIVKNPFRKIHDEFTPTLKLRITRHLHQKTCHIYLEYCKAQI